ncbi:hypothetical protein ACIBQ1_18130 [Nonomuraea sp. NPDC050153]|uniref:hypothetical protein n=1 Tax=Nonomuraea sp. NPDC050153 TaxID=3364359 RepID=UPI0037BAEFEC
MTLAPPAARLARWPASSRRGLGWLPPGVVCAGAVAVFLCCGVSARDLAVFAAYLGAGVALPGTLLWRALTGGGRSTAEDVAAGLALGYAVEVLAYLPARAAGAPLLVLVPPAGVLCAFACVPRLRRHWRGGGGERMPLWCAWALAAVVGYLIAWSALHLYRVPISGAYVDLPYHLALVGEVKHHVPPTLPSVLGERLSYHWFVYAELAATSWVTGIEPVTLVYRLATLPMAAAMVVLVAVLGRRLGGSWGAGVAAVGVAYFLMGPVLQEDVVFTTRPMFTVWASPTQTFGALLFAPVVLLLTGGGRRGRAALVVLLAALTGAKATFLPLLLAGLLVVVAVRWVVERRVPWAWLGTAGGTLACLLVAQFVVFGQGSQGTVVAPFAATRGLWGLVAGVGMPELASVPVTPLLVLTVVHLFCLLCVWGGAAALGRRALEPPMSLLLGMGAAGVGAAVLLGHPSDSQLYFLESVRPYLSVAAMCGVAGLSAGRRVPWTMVAAGAGVALLAAWIEMPGGAPVRAVVPYLVLGLVAAGVLLWRRGAVLAVVALLAGYAVPASARELALRVVPEDVEREMEIPAGALKAGRWLRAHSSPDDVVATDLHCRPVQAPGCDSRHYWVSGFTERRVLVEGWAYAESTLSRAELFVSPYLEVPFADPARLAANDAVFRAPTAANVRHLATRYGVKWLFTGTNPELGKFARLRFRNSTSSVYQLTAR